MQKSYRNSEFINPGLYKISAGVTFKQFNIFNEIYSEKNDILLAPGCRFKNKGTKPNQNTKPHLS